MSGCTAALLTTSHVWKKEKEEEEKEKKQLNC